ncbi:MAG: uroporphyrinogen-III C-methyltransferase [Sphingopyxis sp.]
MTSHQLIDEFAPGQVWLVGAGPGDPGLLTRKAEALMRAASVIFYDALVSPAILALAPAHVRMVAVGKRSGRHSKDQRSINALLVGAALAGERVVRLKGGDPSVFGRSVEEMQALEAVGVTVRICAGVTAASAAAASLGASLTLRDKARKLMVLTAHVSAGGTVDMDWPAIVDADTALAVYMGKAAAGIIARHLMDGGLPPDTPVALVENASLPDERQFRTTLALLGLAARTALGDGPALLLIGAPFAARDGQCVGEYAGQAAAIAVAHPPID